MKSILFVLLFFSLQVSAEVSAQQINLSLKNASFVKAMEEISKKTNYDFSYNDEILKRSKPVTISLRNQTLSQALQQLFSGQPLTYEIIDQIIIVKDKLNIDTETPKSAIRQPERLRGKVSTDSGGPLVGASIRVKGATVQSVTDQDGVFNLPVQYENRIIEVSFVGYVTVQVTAKSEMNIILQRSNASIQEVSVVMNTGYQSLSKERSAGAFSKPDLQVFGNRSGSMNVLERLDGLIPGLSLNVGATNGDFYPVNIRGLSTINGSSQPLYVVDGVAVSSLSMVNPNDVADVTVLKDATAASIWGARASNGVVVVTTKSGNETGGRINVEYDMFYSFRGKPEIDLFSTMNSAQYIETVQALYNMPGYIRDGATDWATITTPDATNGRNAVLPHEYILYNRINEAPGSYQALTLTDLANANNIQQQKDIWYRNAALTNHTVSLSGKGERYGAYASLAYTGQQDPTPGTRNQTYQLHARQDYQPHQRIGLYLLTNVLFQEQSSRRAITPDSRFVPYALFRDNSGQSLDHSWLYWTDALQQSYEDKSNGLTDIGRLNLAYDPDVQFDKGHSHNTFLNTRILSGMTIDLGRGLRFEGVYGADLYNTQQRAYDDASGFDGQVEIAKLTVTQPALKSYVPTTGGKLQQSNVQQRNWTIRNQFSFERNWEERKHQLNALLGMEYQRQTQSAMTNRLRGYDENLLTYKAIDYNTTSTGIANTIINTTGTYRLNDQYSESYLDTRFRSFYANIAYTWLSKYTLNASSRFDESNLFGKDVSAQSRPVWSVGGSWLLSNESFMNSLTWVDRLQTRLTYGITGNSPAPGSGASYDILAPGFAFGVPSGSINALFIDVPGNSRLTWEQTSNINAGVDFTLIHRRISGSIDYYHKHTTDLLGPVPQSAITGYPVVFGNSGVINNQGVEINLQTRNVQTRDFSWSTLINFARNKGKVVSLYADTPLEYASSIIRGVSALYFDPAHLGLVEGHQPFSLFAYRYAGLDDQGDPTILRADGSTTKEPGVARVEDLVNMGSTTPLMRGGFSNFFRYKQFGLDINLVYGLDFVLRRDVNTFYTGRVMSTNYTTGNLHTDFLDRWQQQGDESRTDVPAYDPAANRTSRTDLNYYTAADINVIKGDYIKLRDITFTYALPESVLRPVHMKQVTLRAQLNNIMLWTANGEGIDPEFYNGIGTRSTDFVTGVRRIPFNQGSFTLGAHITF